MRLVDPSCPQGWGGLQPAAAPHLRSNQTMLTALPFHQDSDAESVVTQKITQAKAPAALKSLAALAATTGALYQTLLALASAHGGKDGPWLDQLEAQFARDAKNISFTGTSMEAEAEAVEAALANLTLVMTKVRTTLAARARAEAPLRNASWPAPAAKR